MSNISKYIRSFMIVISNEKDKDNHRRLIDYIRIDNFIYDIIDNNIDNQFIIIIYNISLDDAMFISNTYNQENIMYCVPIGKNFNIRIPFFEQVEKVCNFIESRMKTVENSKKLLSESMDDRYTGKHRMVCRFKLYKQK